MQNAANKADLVATAHRIGVPVPLSVIATGPLDIPDVSALGFPMVIKPWRSRIWTTHGWASTSVSYAASHAELAADLSRRPIHEFPLLLQERIVGAGMGVFACYHEGRPIALFSHKRLRERPPWGGVSVLSESVAIDPVTAAYATRLLDELKWQGVAMVEFKHDARDGVPKLMEINGRFWGSLQLAIDAGVDFPALLVGSVTGQPIEAQPAYQLGTRNRWFWGDVDSLLVTLFGGANMPTLPRIEKTRAIGEFLKFYAADLHYDNPKLDDPIPFLAESGAWIRKLLQGAAAHRTDKTPSHIRVGVSPKAATPEAAFEDATPQTVAVDTYTSFDQLGLDAKQWNAIAAASDSNTIFHTHQWARSWSATVGSQHEPLFFVATTHAGSRAVASFVIEHSVSRERTLRFLGDGRADYCDVLAPSAEPQLIEALCTAVLSSTRWDRLDLNNIPARSQTIAIMKRCCERAGYFMLADDDIVCPTLLIEGHETSALNILNKPSLRRRQSYFDRSGKLEVVHLTDARKIVGFLDQFFAQHEKRWANSGSPSLFLEPRNREFYRELTESLTGTSWLLFTVVEFEGRPIAFHYGFDYCGTVTWYKPSFEMALASRSPGLTLLRHLIEYAIQHRRRELDFTVGGEAFKTRFTNDSRRNVRLQVFRDSLRFGLARSRRSLSAAVKRVSAT